MMTDGNGAAKAGHNSELTDEQRQALHFTHQREYAAALAEKKAADADLKNVAKRIKAEGGSVEDIKESIALGEGGGEAALKAKIEALLRVARWNGCSIGSQAEMVFETADLRPISEKAGMEGRVAGMEGKTCQVPDQYAALPDARDAWLSSWHAGQKILMDTLALTRGGGNSELIKAGEQHQDEQPAGEAETGIPASEADERDVRPRFLQPTPKPEVEPPLTDVPVETRRRRRAKAPETQAAGGVASEFAAAANAAADGIGTEPATHVVQ